MSVPPAAHRFTRILTTLMGPAAMLSAMLAMAPIPVAAQAAPGVEPPGHIDIAQGEATLDRDGERLTADQGMPVVPGDRLSTGRGRVRLLFPDGTAVALDEFSDLEIASSELLRLTIGRLRVTMPGDAGTRLQIDTAAASAHLDEPGDYRVAVMGSTTYGQTELAVMRGYAELEGDRGSVKLRPGERSLAWPHDLPSRPESFNSARIDAFDQWVLGQQDTRTARSSQYLPPDLRAYGGTLDQSGTWGFEGSYGYVWYPTVAPGWRPYYTGYWASIGSYGWTWVGAERWAWPTHHYGRWGYVRDRWFWIPDRRWGPAWVSWGAAPGYVGWCPLGFDNRPLFDFAVSMTFGSGWTVLPRERFGVHGAYANRFAVAPRSLAAHAPLVLQSGPPERAARPPAGRIAGSTGPRGRAVPRYSQPDGGVPSARPPRAGAVAQSGTASGADVRRPRAPGSIAPRTPGRDTGAPRADRSPGERSGGAIAPPRRDDSSGASTTPRQFPFGDFRRRDTGVPPAAAPPATGDAPADSVRPPRSRASGDMAPAERPQPPQIYMPPPSGAGRARGDASSGGGTDRGASRGSGDRGGNARGGGTIGGGRPAESPRAGSGDRGGSQQGQQGTRGDGRAHDPGSRRPR